MGLEVDWVEVEEQFDKFGLSPAAPSQASRVAVPIYSGDRQVGEGDDDRVLSVAEEADCAREREHGILEAGHKASNGIDDRSAADEDDRNGSAAAVLQSEAEDDDAGLENIFFLFAKF